MAPNRDLIGGFGLLPEGHPTEVVLQFPGDLAGGLLHAQADLPEAAPTDPLEAGRYPRERCLRVRGQVVVALSLVSRACDAEEGLPTDVDGDEARLGPRFHRAGFSDHPHDGPEGFLELGRVRLEHRSAPRQTQEGLPRLDRGDEVRRNLEEREVRAPLAVRRRAEAPRRDMIPPNAERPPLSGQGDGQLLPLLGINFVPYVVCGEDVVAPSELNEGA